MNKKKSVLYIFGLLSYYSLHLFIFKMFLLVACRQNHHWFIRSGCTKDGWYVFRYWNFWYRFCYFIITALHITCFLLNPGRWESLLMEKFSSTREHHFIIVYLDLWSEGIFSLAMVEETSQHMVAPFVMRISSWSIHMHVCNDLSRTLFFFLGWRQIPSIPHLFLATCDFMQVLYPWWIWDLIPMVLNFLLPQSSLAGKC